MQMTRLDISVASCARTTGARCSPGRTEVYGSTRVVVLVVVVAVAVVVVVV